MSSFSCHNLLRVRIAGDADQEGQGALDQFIKTVCGRDHRGNFTSLCFSCICSPSPVGDRPGTSTSPFEDPGSWRRDKWFIENWGASSIDSSTIVGPLTSQSSGYPEALRPWKDDEARLGVSDDGVCWTFSTGDHPPLAWVQKASSVFPELEFFLSYESTRSSYPANLAEDELKERIALGEDEYFRGSAHFAKGACLSWSTNNDELQDEYWPPFGDQLSAFVSDLDRQALHAWCNKYLDLDPAISGGAELTQQALNQISDALDRAMDISKRQRALVDADRQALMIMNVPGAIGAALAFLSDDTELWLTQADQDLKTLEDQA